MAKVAHFGPFWPVLAQKDLAIFRPPGAKKSKKKILSKITIYDPPEGLGASKTQNWPSGARQRPPFGPFCVYFGPFGAQKMRFSRKFFFHSKSLLNHPRRVWDPQKPNIGLLGPLRDPMWAILGAFWASLTCFGLLGPVLACLPQKDLAIFRPPGAKKSKKKILSKITIYDPPEGLGASKTQNWPSGARQRPPFGPFSVYFGPFGAQKMRFSRKKNFTPNHF